jgi:hypothetical protein
VLQKHARRKDKEGERLCAVEILNETKEDIHHSRTLFLHCKMWMSTAMLAEDKGERWDVRDEVAHCVRLRMGRARYGMWVAKGSVEDEELRRRLGDEVGKMRMRCMMMWKGSNI